MGIIKIGYKSPINSIDQSIKVNYESAASQLREFCKPQIINSAFTIKTLDILEKEYEKGQIDYTLLNGLYPNLFSDLIKKYPNLKTNFELVANLFEDCFNKIQQNSDVIEFYIPKEKNNSFLNYLVEIATKPPEEFDTYRIDVQILLVLFCTTVLCKIYENKKAMLKQYDQFFSFSNSFSNQKSSVLENIRHSVAHSDIIVETKNNSLFMNNIIGNISTTTTKNELLAGYYSAIGRIETDLNQTTNSSGIKLVHSILKQIQNGGTIDNWLPFDLTLCSAIVMLNEIKWNRIDQLLNDLVNNSSNGFDFDKYESLQLNGLNYNVKLIRNAIAHGDYSWNEPHIVLHLDRNSTLSLSYIDLPMIFNHCSMLLEFPIIYASVALIGANLNSISTR